MILSAERRLHGHVRFRQQHGRCVPWNEFPILLGSENSFEVKFASFPLFFFVLFFNKKTFFCLYFWNETNVKCTVQNNFPLIWRDRKSELVYLPRDMRTWQIYFFCSSFYFIFMLEYVWVDPFIPLFTHFLLFSYVLIHEYYISFYWFSDTQGRIFPLN